MYPNPPVANWSSSLGLSVIGGPAAITADTKDMEVMRENILWNSYGDDSASDV